MYYILYFVNFHLYLIIIQICEFTAFITLALGAHEGKIQHPPFSFLLNPIYCKDYFYNSELLSSKYLTQIPSLFLNNVGTGPVYKYRCGLSI